MEIVSTMETGSLVRELDLEPVVSDLQSQLGEVVNANFRGDSMVTLRLKKKADLPIQSIELGHSKFGVLRLKRI